MLRCGQSCWFCKDYDMAASKSSNLVRLCIHELPCVGLSTGQKDASSPSRRLFFFLFTPVFQQEIPLWFNLLFWDSDYSTSQGLVEGQEVLY